MKKKITFAIVCFVLALTMIAPLTAFADWEKQSDGWHYTDEEGNPVANEIREINGANYSFDANGIMRTGWFQDDWGDWYYAESNGVLVTGWKQIKGVWYYFHPDYFNMYYGWNTINGKEYYFTANGALKIGWFQDEWGYWYYSNSNGVIQRGWQYIGGKWYYLSPSMYYDGIYSMPNSQGVYKEYYFNPNGTLGIGWSKRVYTYDSGYTYTAWYYSDSNGVLQTGWQYIGGKWYYLSYEMYSDGWYTIDDKPYFFDKNGAMGIGWCKHTYNYGDGSTYTTWYYANGSGVLQTGWLQIGGKWYYFDKYSYYMYTGPNYIDGQLYVFNGDGAWTTKAGWLEVKNSGSSTWYYIKADGQPATGWQLLGGVWYYFAPGSGYMYSNGVRYVYEEGKNYAFAKNGAWISGTGWQEFKQGSASEWAYTQNGTPLTDWQLIGGKWYYFFPYNCLMTQGDTAIDGILYCFKSNGVYTGRCTTLGWRKANGTWYYVEKNDGTLAHGWLDDGGSRYYLDDDSGYMYYGGRYEIGGESYMFAQNGILQTGLFDMWGDRYYANEDGALQSGWQTIDGNQYYFDVDYFSMYRGGWYTIDDVDYYFDWEGIYDPNA